MTTLEIKWFAKGLDIAKCGPFDTAVEAAASMELIGGGKPDGFAIWPEYVQSSETQPSNAFKACKTKDSR
jgi:hypothetical protein